MNRQVIPRQRAIIDRRVLAARIEALAGEHGDKARPQIVALLREALDSGRAELARRLEKRFAGEASRLAAIGEYFMTVEAPEDAIRALGAGVALAGGELDIRYRLAQAYRLGLRLDEAIREHQLVIGESGAGRNQRALRN